ncbi:hypothetical protein amb2076 [Paramagnetospirillum magneticum AMB-1]|uniref:Uncharacterized protein n=1 Tax=Paramagnetospirillum magneticum (strain ATCC 700264 / AMB-1) TaxID=342108 RepID=Q2W5J5_PARM1|nr:hypothetical protein amb2076 [Paramagnetospirillum magneticum AMB-1]
MLICSWIPDGTKSCFFIPEMLQQVHHKRFNLGKNFIFGPFANH